MKPEKSDLYNRMNAPSDNYNPWKESDKGYFIKEKGVGFHLFVVSVMIVFIIGLAVGLTHALVYFAK